MIYVRSTKNISDFQRKNIYLIMRSVTGELQKIAALPNVHVVSELAPPQDLYEDFLKWKKNYLWDEDQFYSKFLPRYLHYIFSSQEALDKLNQLSNTKQDIYLCCSCLQEKTCHRLIVAALLYLRGVMVNTDDAKNLFKMAKNLKERAVGDGRFI